MLWASATGRRFEDKDHKPTAGRWIEKVLKKNINKVEDTQKITKQDVKNTFYLLKK